MMHLFLMRHAQADDPLTGQQDWERPLTRRGQLDAEEMSRRLKARKLRIGKLLVSPALRTRQTAQALTRAYPQASLVIVEELYLASRKQLLGLLQQQGGTSQHLMLIGHNPGISELAHELSQERPIDAMPTAAVFSASFELAAWQDLLPASGVNVDLDYPQRPA